MKKLSHVAVVGALVALTGCSQKLAVSPGVNAVSSSASSIAASLSTQNITLQSPNGSSLIVHAEFARTPDEQARGLMERTSLAPDTGMMFVFPAPQILTFWMKDTLIPLDILFFDADGNFVSATSMMPCAEGTTCTIYPSQGEAQFALEVPVGYAEEHQVGGGWRLMMGQ